MKVKVWGARLGSHPPGRLDEPLRGQHLLPPGHALRWEAHRARRRLGHPQPRAQARRATTAHRHPANTCTSALSRGLMFFALLFMPDRRDRYLGPRTPPSSRGLYATFQLARRPKLIGDSRGFGSVVPLDLGLIEHPASSGERPTWLGSLLPNMEGGRMSIVVRFHPTNATKEKYDESLRRMEAAGIWPNPPGLEVHVAFGPDDDLRASEIWSSREQVEAYGEKLMPILSDMGIEFSAEPEIFEVQNLIK